MDEKAIRKSKVSDMILKMAEGFLSMGKNLEHRGNLLRCACTAWNIACFEHEKRHVLLNKYVETFREVNSASDAACDGIREDMRKLIEEKNCLFPHAMIRILNSRIFLEDGKERVEITSTPFIDNKDALQISFWGGAINTGS